MTGPRLSALVVHHASGPFTRACLRSIRRGWEGRRLELVVVDTGTADRPGEREHLDVCAAEGAEVIEAGSNLGYAGGVERALAATRGGGNDDLVLVTNPDVVLLPGALDALAGHLAADGRCGAVGPRAFLDEDLALQLPLVPLPTAGGECAEALGRRRPALARAWARRRALASLALWTAEAPLATPMLSGACLLLRRRTVAGLGALLDPRYPLYYEDADLARRLAARGERLCVVPAARALHHWSRSAGAGAAFEGEPRRRWRASRARYHRRWSGLLGRASLALAERFAGGEALPIHALVDLGAGDEPIEVPLAGDGPHLVEVAATPTFSLAASALASGPAWRFPAAAWSWLFPGRYWVRALDARTGEPRGAWTFERTGATRTEPVDADAGEVAA